MKILTKIICAIFCLSSISANAKIDSITIINNSKLPFAMMQDGAKEYDLNKNIGKTAPGATTKVDVSSLSGSLSFLHIYEDTDSSGKMSISGDHFAHTLPVKINLDTKHKAATITVTDNYKATVELEE